MSTLGRVVLLGERPGRPRSRNFTLAVWRHGLRLERRLMRSFGGTLRPPLLGCDVQNCRVLYTSDPAAAEAADAVLFHLQLTKKDALPPRRRSEQRWIFLSDESPRHVFLSRNNISHYNSVFNWSMGYRYDTDVPVPYGRTVPGRSQALVTPKTKMVATMGSNCDGSGRWQYVRQLQKLLPVDVYGRCGTLKCPGHYDKDCKLLGDYKFYLAFENSRCDGYITEKVFWHGLGKGAVPVVWGARKRDYEKVLPPGSFIFLEDFASVGELAKYLTFLSDTPEEYARYHAWRSAYHVVNEHGYFGSPIHYYCRICQALNFNSEERKVYSRLDQFWGVKEHCITAGK
ncbi:glycoprotein 3-alpha-L-fucosyltransferase A-like [Pollicipes pollicipes]|uniref:glycoprotein 3-alpha-L-fucosyltransferase A-like n=1 Tax=Pollicipes pollicipes TaxID=41117 RepID=UPI001884A33F|nr:glycoprotein 3-alpha-L-fucosyltransferase A-like [Pollicipes pollicipes]